MSNENGNSENRNSSERYDLSSDIDVSSDKALSKLTIYSIFLRQIFLLC